MNIGSIKQNEAGIYIGRVSTLAVAMTIALREVRSVNPKAPKYEIHALNTVSRTWVQVGALFELASNATGETFLNGKIDDPSLAQPLYVSAFRQDDGSYNVVWSRPSRKRDVAAAMATRADDGLPPLPGEAEEDAGTGAGEPAGGRSRRGRRAGTDDGLGESTAPELVG